MSCSLHDVYEMNACCDSVCVSVREPLTDFDDTVTRGLKAPSAGRGYEEHVPVVTRNTSLLWVLMEQ